MSLRQNIIHFCIFIFYHFYTFFLYFFIPFSVWPFLLNLCGCRRLLLQWNPLNDTHTRTRTHKHKQTRKHTHASAHARTHISAHSGGLVWTSDRPVTDTSTWQHTTLTRDRHITGGIRTRNPRKRADAHPRLRPCGQLDCPSSLLRPRNLFYDCVQAEDTWH